MYPQMRLDISMVSEVARRYRHVTLSGEKFGSNLESRSLSSGRVMASWSGEDGDVDSSASIRPGEVKFYFANCLCTDEGSKEHIFACMQWHSEDSMKNKLRRPVEIWQPTTFEPPGPATFMPIQRVHCKFAAALYQMSGSQKLVVTPIVRTLC